MLLACYNWKLEKAFLGDIEAVLPEPGMTFDDDENDPKDKEKEDALSMNNEAIDKDDTDVSESILNNDEWENDSEVFNDLNSNDRKSICSSNDEKNESNGNEVDSSKKEPDDPLQKAKFVRKTDSDKNFSCGVPIRDFSDPLRATLSVDDDVFLPKEEAKLKADTHSDR